MLRPNIAIAFADDASPPALAAESTSTATFHIERVGAAALGARAFAWANLCERALERNVFLDPAFALPLFQHVESARRISFLLVWAENEPSSFGRLLGLFPLTPSRFGPARIHVHEQTSCGTPLVDRNFALEVLEAALTWLGERRIQSHALALSEIVKDGPFHAALCRCCETSSRDLIVLEARTRAVLHRDNDGRLASFASARRRQQYARQARRLARTGLRAYTQARSQDEVTVALERFLRLEEDGWKGARGTALLADAGRATFARGMIRWLAQDGRCRIDSLEIDGRPVAMGIIITDKGRSHFWKIAFDEAYAIFSPGVQFALELTHAQLADSGIALTDSCAPANHPMIDRIWPDRVIMIDVLVALKRGRLPAFARSLRVERCRRALRHTAKRLWGRMRRRRGD